MLGPVSQGRNDGRSSFRRLVEYITEEKDPITGEVLSRGEIVLSDNLIIPGVPMDELLETVPARMRGVASQNARVQDPIFHFQITWGKGEKPTREEWEGAATRVLKSLGFGEHQYLIGTHDNTEYFHIHIALNRVNPETYRAQDPGLYKKKIDEQLRWLEHEHNQRDPEHPWRVDHGLYMWSDDLNRPVETPKDFLEQWYHERQAAEREDTEFNYEPEGKERKVEYFKNSELYRNAEEVTHFARGIPAKDLRALLKEIASQPTPAESRWSEVHELMAKHGLQIHKGEKGGYTVQRVGTDIVVKASAAFRDNFSGKANRESTETLLGRWEPMADDVRQRADRSVAHANEQGQGSGKVLEVPKSAEPRRVTDESWAQARGGYEALAPELKASAKKSYEAWAKDKPGAAKKYSLHDYVKLYQDRAKTYRDREGQEKEKQKDREDKRAAQREKRASDRRDLKNEFLKYRAGQRKVLKGISERLAEKKGAVAAELRRERKGIRATQIPWKAKKLLLSHAVAMAVAKDRLLSVELAREREANRVQTYQEWVTGQAEKDTRAAAQMRGWRYQDQRNMRRLERELAEGKDVARLSSGSDPDRYAWEQLAVERLKELRKQEELAEAIRQTRWAIDKRTGEVLYTIRGRQSIIDHGKTVSLINADEAATVLALEMAVKKFGPVIAAQGSAEWKENLARIAARNGVRITFTDAGMMEHMNDERAMYQQVNVFRSMSERFTLYAARSASCVPFQTSNRPEIEEWASGVYGGTGASFIADLHAKLPAGGRREQDCGLFKMTIELDGNGAPTYTVEPHQAKAEELATLFRGNAARAQEQAKTERQRLAGWKQAKQTERRDDQGTVRDKSKGRV